MSVFRGSIVEYPGVMVDHFTSSNCKRGRVFFLSHCHKDHMTGLSSPPIENALRTHGAHLYCSEVTHSLLLRDPHMIQLAPYLKALPMEQPVAMSVNASSYHEKLNFTVTLLPAGHCPGSSMFFFQGARGNVLYTGDFRLTLEETKRLQSLHSGGSLLDITALYMDTTFFHPIATDIPSRVGALQRFLCEDISRDHILKLIESWLSQSPNNVVHLQCAMFGFEHIYMAVHKKFRTKIHIASWRVNAYQEISGVVDCLTTDGESTRIHACNFRKGPGLPCGSRAQRGPPKVLRIKPSTQWFLFAKRTSTRPYEFLPHINMYRVIHSMHASYSELRDFVTYLKPKRIIPCVVPFGDSSLAGVCSRLKGLLPHSEVTSIIPDQTQELPRTAAQKPKQSDKCISPNDSENSDGWLTSAESIDEFPSTEEQASAENTPFYHSQEQPPTTISLPSLVPTCQPCLSPPPNTASGTYGSLQQSPIDLFLTASSSSSISQECVERNTQESSDENTGPNVEALVLPHHRTDKDDDCVIDDVDRVGGIHNKREQDRTEEKIQLVGSGGHVSNHVSGPSTPQSKRLRLSTLSASKDSSVTRRLFQDRHKLVGPGEELSVPVLKPKPASPSSPVFIDLTQDEETSDLPPKFFNGSTKKPIDLTIVDLDHRNKDPYQHSSSVEMCPPHQSVVELSDDSERTTRTVSPFHSQRCVSVESAPDSDPHNSPYCIPPTPGRQNIECILGKKYLL